MAFRTPADVAPEFGAHARRALIITTVKQESLAVKAHMTNVEIVAGDKGRFYEYGRFPDPAGDWLIVHAITAQGNSDAALIANTAHKDFDGFQAQLFVGVAGSLKDDIPIGSVVLGDYVYNGHSAKVEDAETFARPHGLPAANELLAISQFLIYSDEWRNLIRAPHGMELPEVAKYPCKFPPDAVVKGIVSGEEVVAGGKSTRYVWLRSRFNDCGAVEMEGWGAMNAARYQNTPAVVVRGISDMCAGKDHARDEVHQPIAAAHAAAFAFSILSFRSKSPAGNSPPTRPVVVTPVSLAPAAALEERRVEFVLNFDGAREDWPVDRVDAFVEQLRKLADDEKVALVRIDAGSVRLVLSVREGDLTKFGLPRLREVAADAGANLLGASTIAEVREAEAAKKALASASANLLAWDKALPNGAWIERPERGEIEARFSLESSSTVLLGEPGSGKSALLSRVACDLLDQGATVFAIKSDFLSPELASEPDLQRELDLPAPPSELILRLAALQPVFVLIDQLDALASQLDLRGGRLNLMLNLVRRIGGVPNVHVLLSARRFEFNHDVRLRVIAAEPLLLELPPWRNVEEQLGAAGADPGAWPEKARDVVRIPQALKTFVTLAGAGRREPFTTYQSMLEQLWRDRIASAEDGEALVALLSDLAGAMAEEEALWLAASRFDGRLGPLHRLEALGFVVRSDNGLSVAFSHQTVFEFVLARTFLRKAGLLSDYVLERQDSLFVRAKAWSALNYLREAEVGAYEREFRDIWAPLGLRRHLRLLLIEFLGQVASPMRFESAILEEVLKSSELRAFGLKAIASGNAWFAEFALTAVRDAMSGTDAEAGLALQILNRHWKTHPDAVLQLVRDMWLPITERDRYTWAVLGGCEAWSEPVEQVAVAVLGRGAITSWQVDHLASTVAVTRPDAAARLVRAQLDLLLFETAGKPAPAEEEEAASWSELRRWSRLDDLLDASEWDNLPALAETAPSEFLAVLWDWYVAAFEKVVSRSGSVDDGYVYPGRYILELRSHSSRTRSAEREKPLVDALQIAVAELAEKAPADFLAWAKAGAGLEVLAVQQLIADGFGIAAARLASEALEWLLGDVRRFQLGTSRGHRQTTMAMLAAFASHWSKQEVERVERAILAYQPPVPSNIAEAEGRRIFANIIRATRKDLLRSLGIERLSPKSRELVVTEDRALGDRYARSIGEVGGGFIGSPMEAGSMAKAKDRDILRILREVPDDTNWDHPTHWMRGGSIQLSRAFAEFGRNDPARAVRLIEQFEPTRQERAAGYALDAMADDARNDGLVLGTLMDLHARGFQASELRDSAARALEKIGNRHAAVPDGIVEVLLEWLGLPDEGSVAQDVDPDAETDIDKPKEDSILWGMGGITALPAGNFTVLSALASVLLNRGEPGRDLYVGILEEHLLRERNPKVWTALLSRLGNAGGARPEVLSAFLRRLFAKFPAILRTQEAVVFLAYAQRWDDRMVLELVIAWQGSDRAFLQRAYGELVGLVSTSKDAPDWSEAKDRIIASGTEHAKIGLAHAALNMWADHGLRRRSGEILVALLSNGSRELIAAVMDVFRVVDALPSDASTTDLLRAIADPGTDLSAAPSHFVVEHLQALLPREEELVAAIAGKLVVAWRSELSDMRTGTAMAAPQLTDLALTLHRLGGASRKAGIDLFEAMIEIDAYGARETLAEVDGRFGLHQPIYRRQLRRRKPRPQGAKAA